jgi:hypothetical protein
MGPDVKVCKNTPFELMPTTDVEKPGGQWFVNNTPVSAVPFKGQTNVPTQLIFRYMLKNGCFTDDVVKIDIHPSLNYTLNDVDLCLNELKEYNKVEIELQGSNTVKKFELTKNELNVNLNNTILNQWEFGLIENKPSSFNLFSVIEDINSCIYIDTINVEIKDTFKAKGLDKVKEKLLDIIITNYHLGKSMNREFYDVDWSEVEKEDGENEDGDNSEEPIDEEE